MTITITNLPLQSSVTDNTLLPVETAGITGHITALSLQNYLASASLNSITASTGSFTTLTASSLSSGTFTTGTITATGNINAQSNVIISGSEYITGNSYATNYTASNNIYAGNIVVSGNSSIAGNEIVTGNLTVLGNLAVTNAAILFSSATVAAAGTNQNTATPLTTDNVFVTSGTGGVRLPSAAPGREISVTNNSGVSITVYPATGQQIEAAGTNVGTLVPNNATLGLIAKSGSNWWTIQPIYVAGSGITISQSANGAVTWSAVVTGTDTLATVTARGATTSSNVTMSGGLNISSLFPTANASVNIGSASGWFNTIYGTSTHAQYADLAECYEADAVYEPGTVMIFGTDTEVTVSQTANDPAVAGVVSTNPAYLMNGQLVGENVVALALTGRVPCRVVGTVKRGDRMVTSTIPGVAMVNNDPEIGTVIGKALGNYDSTEIGVIEVVVGRI